MAKTTDATIQPVAERAVPTLGPTPDETLFRISETLEDLRTETERGNAVVARLVESSTARTSVFESMFRRSASPDTGGGSIGRAAATAAGPFGGAFRELADAKDRFFGAGSIGGGIADAVRAAVGRGAEAEPTAAERARETAKAEATEERADAMAERQEAVSREVADGSEDVVDALEDADREAARRHRELISAVEGIEAGDGGGLFDRDGKDRDKKDGRGRDGDRDKKGKKDRKRDRRDRILPERDEKGRFVSSRTTAEREDASRNAQRRTEAVDSRQDARSKRDRGRTERDFPRDRDERGRFSGRDRDRKGGRRRGRGGKLAALAGAVGSLSEFVPIEAVAGGALSVGGGFISDFFGGGDKPAPAAEPKTPQTQIAEIAKEQASEAATDKLVDVAETKIERRMERQATEKAGKKAATEAAEAATKRATNVGIRNALAESGGKAASRSIAGAAVRSAADRVVTSSPSLSGKAMAGIAEAVPAVASTVGKALKILGPAASILTAGMDAYSGFADKDLQSRAFGLGEGQEATYLQKQSAAVANMLDMGGLVSGGLGLLGADVDTADMAEMVGGGIGEWLYDWLHEKDKDDGEQKSVIARIGGFFGIGGDNGGGAVTAVPQPTGRRGGAIMPTMPKPGSGRTDAKPVKPSRNAGQLAHADLGALSERYESGGRGAGVVSSGRGDYGGQSYGTYQMASKGGERSTVAKFVRGSEYASEFEGLRPGTAAFNAKWKDLAAKDEGFGRAQHDYIKKTHFDPVHERLQSQGIDLSGRSKAVQDVLWSTGVQHGGNSRIVERALAGQDVSQMSDEQVIEAVYAERGKRKETGELAYFSKNSADVQDGVAKRFEREKADALAMLEAERAQKKTTEAKPEGEAKPQPMGADEAETPEEKRPEAVAVEQKETGGAAGGEVGAGAGTEVAATPEPKATLAAVDSVPLPGMGPMPAKTAAAGFAPAGFAPMGTGRPAPGIVEATAPGGLLGGMGSSVVPKIELPPVAQSGRIPASVEPILPEIPEIPGMGGAGAGRRPGMGGAAGATGAGVPGLGKLVAALEKQTAAMGGQNRGGERLDKRPGEVKPPSNIPTEFSDAMLTLLAYDRL